MICLMDMSEMPGNVHAPRPAVFPYVLLLGWRGSSGLLS